MPLILNLLLCFFSGLLGVIVYNLIKIKKLQTRFPDYLPKQLLKEYWIHGWIGGAISMVIVILALITYNEWIGFSYQGVALKSFVVSAFAIIGYCGNSLAFGVFGSIERVLLSKIEAAIGAKAEAEEETKEEDEIKTTL
jgi:H+/Cl- antiporter ClcA